MVLPACLLAIDMRIVELDCTRLVEEERVWLRPSSIFPFISVISSLHVWDQANSCDSVIPLGKLGTET